ncbi:MAG TPA: BamA/TamA family outer membrane protein, partial [candidate division Zixibacteria bacterium]|nr:BamA/TamA family outer membrane protein [candidate division Zixibacteria bacterium]
MNYFTNVIPDVKNLPNGDVDIDVAVEEKQTGQLNAGAGYSARDKLVGTFGMGIPNLFGNGQTLNFNLEFGGRRNSSQISFTEPWMFGRPTLFGADVFTLNRQFEGYYTEGRRGGSLRAGRRLRWPDNYFRASASYRIEGNRFFDFSSGFRAGDEISTTFSHYLQDTAYYATVNGSTVRYFGTLPAGVFPDSQKVETQLNNTDFVINDTIPNSLLDFQEEWKTASIFSLTIARDSRNLPEFASAGSDFRYTISKAGGLFGGYWNYTKHFGEYTKFFKVIGPVALAAKLQFGAITAGEDRRILESERFSPGGTSYLGVVRGYADGSLTPDTLLINASDTLRYDTTLINGSTTTPTDVTLP